MSFVVVFLLVFVVCLLGLILVHCWCRIASVVCACQKPAIQALPCPNVPFPVFAFGTAPQHTSGNPHSHMHAHTCPLVPMHTIVLFLLFAPFPSVRSHAQKHPQCPNMPFTVHCIPPHTQTHRCKLICEHTRPCMTLRVASYPNMYFGNFPGHSGREIMLMRTLFVLVCLFFVFPCINAPIRTYGLPYTPTLDLH